MQHWAFCLEQTLGHRAHAQSLEAIVSSAPAVVEIHRLEYPERSRLPLPWAIRGSYSALRGLQSAHTTYRVVLYHTQSVALLAPLFRSQRYVVSLDATPSQMDRMGHWYAHRRGSRVSEAAKASVYRRVFQRASAFVAWSQWAADSLVNDYGADPSLILVAHPGASREFFDIPRSAPAPKPRILFVGGDFERKGGPALLKTFAAVADRATLCVVSDADIGVHSGVTRLSGVRPGSTTLLDAYAHADIFCLPTLADCTPVVLGEAMASGLPIVTTLVGSNSETVRHGTDGFLIEPGNDIQLSASLTELVESPALRAAMGGAARHAATERFDAARNAARISRLLERVAQ